MSAFICGHDHIDGLLTFAIDHKGSYYDHVHSTRVDFTRANATEIGRILLKENTRSVSHRYGGDDDELPGRRGESVNGYVFNAFTEFYRIPQREQCVMILKACSCFDYQACETDDYDQSLAHRIVDAIRSMAIRTLPGYDNARGWELTRKSLLKS